MLIFNYNKLNKSTMTTTYQITTKFDQTFIIDANQYGLLAEGAHVPVQSLGHDISLDQHVKRIVQIDTDETRYITYEVEETETAHYQGKIGFYQHKVNQAVEQLNTKHLAFYSSKLERLINLEVKRQTVINRMAEQMESIIGPAS